MVFRVNNINKKGCFWPENHDKNDGRTQERGTGEGDRKGKDIWAEGLLCREAPVGTQKGQADTQP